jgi:xanthine dehydrogenase accessory factor
MSLLVCIRGGGDLGSGVALRLFRVGMRVIIAELPQPLVVRRTVSFAEAVYAGSNTVEGITGVQAHNRMEIQQAWFDAQIPVVVDPELDLCASLEPDVLVDARLLKQSMEWVLKSKPLLIGLGPGFNVDLNCHAGVETKRGPSLGRVIRQGSTEPDSGIPEKVNGFVEERVLRAAEGGVFIAKVKIGSLVTKGQEIASVGSEPILAAFNGVVRGMLADGIRVKAGTKVGDLDPRLDAALVKSVSDKSLAVGGGVLEAILSRPELRDRYAG